MSNTTSAAPLRETIRGLFAAVDERDVALVTPYLADDVELRFGNAEPVRGLADVQATSEQFNASLAGIRHEIVDLWEIPGEQVVVVLLEVHYKRLDGGELTLPCCNVFRLRDRRVYDYRIYMDVNPVFTEAE
jgi:ketosteroid isomerase-like protein